MRGEATEWRRARVFLPRREGKEEDGNETLKDTFQPSHPNHDRGATLPPIARGDRARIDAA